VSIRRFAVALAVACGLVSLAPASAGPQKYGGTLVVGQSVGSPGSLDPTVNGSQPLVEILRTMCLRLYEYATNHGKLELEPVLAAAPPVLSADKLHYTIQLRQGIEFNDGTPFNAQAVVTNFQRYTTYPGSIRAGDFADVAGVTATGSYTVVYHLKQRDSTFTGNMWVLSPTALAQEGAGFAANPICAGPFMFDHQVVGDNVTVTKSPYWYKRGAIHLDKIVFKPAVDAAAAVAALEAGDVQVLDRVDTTLVSTVAQDKDLQMLAAPAFNWAGVGINMGNKNGVGNLPYTNVGTPLASSAKLRQAFEEAIDRNAFNRVVYNGLYRADCTEIPPSNTEWYAATKVPCTPYDPADARKLVAQSGFPIPVTVHYLVYDASDLLRQAQFIQAEEAAVGINVVIDSTDRVTFGALERSGNFDTGFFITGTNNPDPNDQLGRLGTVSSANSGGYSNPRLDYVLANGLKASSFKDRAINYRVGQQIAHADRPVIPLYNQVNRVAFSASLVGVEQTATGALSLVNVRYK
jgi:peptide/nickel transport system substrate-binding protein